MRKYIKVIVLLCAVAFMSFLASICLLKAVSLKEFSNIEIFDINKECVVKNVQSSPAIQKEIKKYLKGITNIQTKFNPIPDRGYMVRVLLDNPEVLKNQWLNACVDEVIIIFPEQEKPYLMVFYNDSRYLFFTFDGNTDVLLKKLNYKH